MASRAGAFASKTRFILSSMASASRSWRSQAFPKDPRAITMPPAAGSSVERAFLRFFLERPSNDLLRSSGAVTIRDFAAFIMADVACTRRPRAIMSCLSSSVHPDWSLGFDRLTLARTCRAATSASAGSLFGRPELRSPFPAPSPRTRSTKAQGAFASSRRRTSRSPRRRRRRTLPGLLSCRRGHRSLSRPRRT